MYNTSLSVFYLEFLNNPVNARKLSESSSLKYYFLFSIDVFGYHLLVL